MRFFLKSVLALVMSLLGQIALAFDPFTISDIRLVGIQRVEPGTVFGYLPVKVGEQLDDAGASRAVRALYATGFFNDVRLEVDKNVLVIYLTERPTIASVDVSGAKDISSEVLLKALKELGLGESRIFDRALLDRADQEIKRQYLARGRYSATVTPTVTPLERNRVAVSLAINEGEVAKITQIRIVGNKAFTESELLDELTLSTPTWMSWYTRADQYAREKLAGDLERLRSFYLNRGFLEFSIDSTQVSIDADREGVYITANITEGERYTVTGFKFSGNTMGRDAELAALMLLRPGQVFSGQALNESTRTMTELYGSIGYAFANVNALPDIDREKRTVFFNVSIDPGRRVYVRRINISGNAKSRDEVIRRELRQFESAWYDTDKIRLSRERLVRLGYLTNVTIDTVPVPDAPDQVDLSVNVNERATGTFMIGVGFSSADKIVLTASIVQQNWLGTGKSVGLTLNTGRTQQTIDFNVVDPYFTPDGVSRAFNVFTRNINAQALGLGDYQIRTTGFGMRFGVPYTELDRVSFGGTYERNDITVGVNPPIKILQYVNDFGPQSWQILGVIGWLRDGRDNPLTPTRGLMMSSNFEVTLPVGDVHYTRADFAFQYYQPLTRKYTLGFNGQIARGWALEGGAYPIFKNYYAGGINSVRGFETASLGPRDIYGNPTGGQSKVTGSMEFIFPLPGADQTIRGFLFTDAGNVWAESIDLAGLRYSAGIGLNWLSPLGPFKLSLGVPLDQQPGDRLQKFQFQIGSAF